MESLCDGKADCPQAWDEQLENCPSKLIHTVEFSFFKKQKKKASEQYYGQACWKLILRCQRKNVCILFSFLVADVKRRAHKNWEKQARADNLSV